MSYKDWIFLRHCLNKYPNDSKEKRARYYKIKSILAARGEPTRNYQLRYVVKYKIRKLKAIQYIWGK